MMNPFFTQLAEQYGIQLFSAAGLWWLYKNEITRSKEYLKSHARQVIKAAGDFLA